MIITGNSTETYKNDRTLTISGSLTETIKDNKDVVVTNNYKEQ